MCRMEVVTPNQPTQRQVNIELLRVIAMFMVVVLHCNAFGENMRNTEPLTLNWLGIWFLEKISIVAVNCYVLISGYFLITSEFKYRKLFSIWFQVLFYSICIYFVMGIIYGWGSMFTLMHLEYFKRFQPDLMQKSNISCAIRNISILKYCN